MNVSYCTIAMEVAQRECHAAKGQGLPQCCEPLKLKAALSPNDDPPREPQTKTGARAAGLRTNNPPFPSVSFIAVNWSTWLPVHAKIGKVILKIWLIPVDTCKFHTQQVLTPRCGAKVLSFAGKSPAQATKQCFVDNLRFAVEKDTI